MITAIFTASVTRPIQSISLYVMLEQCLSNHGNPVSRRTGDFQSKSVLVRDVLKNKYSFNFGFQNRSNPPQGIFKLLGTFSKVHFLACFGTFWEKKVPKTFGFGHPPSFLPKIQKLLGHKKGPKSFGLLWNQPTVHSGGISRGRVSGYGYRH